MKFYFLKICLFLPYLIHAQFNYVAHRGASFLAPENTCASINLAWKMGVKAAECDVMITKDSQVVVFHDKTTGRLLEKNYKIKETDYKEFKDLSIELTNNNLPKFKGEKVPLLKDLLINLPDSVTLVIEIKCGTEILNPLKKVLNNYWKTGNLSFISFGYKTIMAIKKAFPEIPCYFLAHMKMDINKRIDELLKGPLDGIDLNHKIINNNLVNKFNKFGKDIWCYTVDSPKIAHRMINLGVNGITTNRPKWLKDVLNSKTFK
ncbi:MAG: hypothetical protein MK207_10670 [Saprospiraceae bacterium]|nr:hypothetical protein [Saprospiraceae bacterium]